MKSRIADSSGFSVFLGIDWSGAKAKSHAGLQLAHAMPGTGGAIAGIATLVKTLVTPAGF